MHDTTARLYQAAAQLRQIHDIAELALALAVSQQTLRNWEQKGLSKKGFQEAKQVFGWNLGMAICWKGCLKNSRNRPLSRLTI